MLFSYTYVPHKMEKMQEFIDYIFFEVWCKAPTNGSFCSDLFNGKPDLKEVIEAFYYSETKGAAFFNGHVQRIHGLFATLTPIEIDKFKQWYQANNDIEKVCTNDSAIHITRYADIEVTHSELNKQLQSFFKNLYPFNPKPLQDKIGNIDDHYKAFIEINRMGKCPFCGISDMRGIYSTKREAYDHYLPNRVISF